jgi:ubiquinone/menaquinone biosynthesis C-methylase UbiE
MYTISHAQDGSKTYVLSTSEQARKNLDYQHGIMANESYQQLQRAGLKKGQVVWDIGCGSGAMTEYIAREVGVDGKVFAVDVSKEQLENTKKRISAAGLKNVTFILADIQEDNDWPIEKADIVYSRLLLMHVTKGKAALINMKSLLRAGGVLSLQESAFSDNDTPDYNPVLKDYFASLVKLGISKGVDFDIGQKLAVLCEDVGFQKIEHYEVQHHYSAKEVKLLMLSRIDEMKEKFIETGIADEKKISEWKNLRLPGSENDQAFYLSSKQYHILAR